MEVPVEVLYQEISDLFGDAGFAGCISMSSANKDPCSPRRRSFNLLWERFQQLEEKLGLTSFEKFQSNPACIAFMRNVLVSLERMVGTEDSLRKNSRPRNEYKENFEVYVAARAEFASFVAACADVGNWEIAMSFGITMSLFSSWPDGNIPY